MAGRGLDSTGYCTVVALDNLTVSYGQHPALHHLHGQFASGSLTAVVGPNGAGKSTLLKTIMALIPAHSGQLAVSVARSKIAYLPQRAELDTGFPISVKDCVMLGFWPSHGVLRALKRTQCAQADAALQTVGLQDFGQRAIGTLSSGQLQRVLFARLLVQDADLILLDEPFNAIDRDTVSALMLLIKQWHNQGRTVVAVLHDDAVVRKYFPQTLLLARRVIGWGNTAQVMTDTNLMQAAAMAEAWDENAEFCQLDSSTPAPHLQAAA